MPYFKNNDVNILFIHIPKTGGSSIENYLSKKYNIELNEKSLFMFLSKLPNCQELKKEICLQHHTYEQIICCHENLGISLNNLFIFSVVRNPYEKILSDLFYLEIIDCKQYQKNEIYNKLLDYTNPNHINKYQNHPLPQYKYLEVNGIINKDIKILKTEDLTNGMKKIGFTDFNQTDNKNRCYNKVNIADYFNRDSLDLINRLYDKDFNYFNYKKL